MRSANHGGHGFFSKRLRAFRRKSRIHSGSPFMADISRTISSLRPFFGLKTESLVVGPAQLVPAEIEIVNRHRAPLGYFLLHINKGPAAHDH